jgi:hypothetical protein
MSSAECGIQKWRIWVSKGVESAAFRRIPSHSVALLLGGGRESTKHTSSKPQRNFKHQEPICSWPVVSLIFAYFRLAVPPSRGRYGAARGRGGSGKAPEDWRSPRRWREVDEPLNMLFLRLNYESI